MAIGDSIRRASAHKQPRRRRRRVEEAQIAHCRPQQALSSTAQRLSISRLAYISYLSALIEIHPHSTAQATVGRALANRPAGPRIPAPPFAPRTRHIPTMMPSGPALRLRSAARSYRSYRCANWVRSGGKPSNPSAFVAEVAATATKDDSVARICRLSALTRQMMSKPPSGQRPMPCRRAESPTRACSGAALGNGW